MSIDKINMSSAIAFLTEFVIGAVLQDASYIHKSVFSTVAIPRVLQHGILELLINIIITEKINVIEITTT